MKKETEEQEEGEKKEGRGRGEKRNLWYTDEQREQKAKSKERKYKDQKVRPYKKCNVYVSQIPKNKIRK